MITQMVGRFSYRFSGFTMTPNNVMPWKLEGVGYFDLNADGSLGGRHRSAITRLWGSGAGLETGEYTLSGRYSFGDDGIGMAAVTFTSDTQVMQGGFDFVIADSLDRFWLISTGARIMNPGGPDIIADEVVSGEAVRMAQITPARGKG